MERLEALPPKLEADPKLDPDPELDLGLLRWSVERRMLTGKSRRPVRPSADQLAGGV